MRILGIESSCDEIGMAIYDSNIGIIGSVLHSQSNIHKEFGGIVPELSARDHVKYLIPLFNNLLNISGIQKYDIDAIAYTSGPGLIGSLLIGASFAKSISFSLNKPSIAINHLEAHVLITKLDYPCIDFPFLALIISGGHTQIIEANKLGKYTLLGRTLDDSVGEVFDKIAREMNIPYPGGSKLANLADSYELNQKETIFIPPFPKPMVSKPGLNFSFSGLKTHTLIVWNNSKKDIFSKKRIAYLFQKAIIDTIIIKCKRAIQQTSHKKIIIAGGVSSNLSLRKSMNKFITNLGVEIYFPRLEFCTDNGAMIAYTGYLYILHGKQDKDLNINVNSRLKL